MARPALHRVRILSVGAPPSLELRQALQDRGIPHEPLADEAGVGTWSTVRGLLVLVPNDPEKFLNWWFRRLLVPALQHGAKVVVIAKLEDVPDVARWRKSKWRAADIEVLAADVSAQKVAEMLARHDPGPAFNATLAVDGENNLSDEEKILLRRAFHHCSRVSLEPIPVGRSGKVFCGFATIPDSRVGPRPLPFFVKFDKLYKIEREHKNYLDCAANYIPFHLRPNLDESRCASGHERAILVGNFIEHSESLAAVVRRGAGHAAISSLFENALRGWRLQGYQPQTTYPEVSIAMSMKGAIHPSTKRVKLEQIARRSRAAALRHGTKCIPQHIADLLDSLPAIKHRVGFTHGDLHGENVRVRGHDAIIIDLASVDTGPLAADPAGLDVWLGLSDASLPIHQWQKMVDELYGLDVLRAMPLPKNEPDVGHRIWNSIRHIRRLATADVMHSDEYACAVAVHLLRTALHPADNQSDDDRRIYGYMLAERLALGLSQKE